MDLLTLVTKVGETLMRLGNLVSIARWPVYVGKLYTIDPCVTGNLAVVER